MPVEDEGDAPAVGLVDDVAGGVDVLVIVREGRDEAGGLMPPLGPAILAQVNRIEGAARRGDHAGELGLVEVVVPAVDREHRERRRRRRRRPGMRVLGGHVPDDRGDNRPLIVIEQRECDGLETWT